MSRDRFCEKKNQRFDSQATVLRENIKQNAFLIKIKYLHRFTFGIIVHRYSEKNCQDKGHFLVHNSIFDC